MRFSDWCASRRRKMRLVIDLIRGKDVNEAYAILKFNKKLAAKQIAKTLKSAVANAEQKALKENESFDPDALFVKKAIVNGGQPLKRFTAGGAGPGHADPEADQPRGDLRGQQGERVMGQKTHPIGLRLGIVQQWSSRWFATKDMPALLKEDELIRKYLKQRLGHAAISEMHIERRPGKVTITVHTGRPGSSSASGAPKSTSFGTSWPSSPARKRRSTSKRSSGPSSRPSWWPTTSPTS